MSELQNAFVWLIWVPLPLLFAAGGEGKFAISSQAFANGQPIPTRYANTGVKGGQNISPPLAWSDPPPGTKSFALACIDRHPIARNWVHWLVINIPKDVRMIAEGASRTAKMPTGAKELNNTFGTLGWGGPQPPPGTGPHNYEFVLYALNVDKLDLAAGARLDDFNKAIRGKVIAEAKLIGTYER